MMMRTIPSVGHGRLSLTLPWKFEVHSKAMDFWMSIFELEYFASRQLSPQGVDQRRARLVPRRGRS